MEYTTKSRKLFLLFNNVLMLVIMLVTLYPLLYVLSASLSEPSEFMKHSGLLFWPLDLNWMSYKAVFEKRFDHQWICEHHFAIGTGCRAQYVADHAGSLLFFQEGDST